MHATDVSNGSRYQFMDLKTRMWDDELCEALGVPRSTLPDLRPSEYHFGTTDPDVCGQAIPITGIVADQQAALYGHGCEDRGDVKATFGTSGVVALNTGSEAVLPEGLIACVGWEDAAGTAATRRRARPSIPATRSAGCVSASAMRSRRRRGSAATWTRGTASTSCRPSPNGCPRWPTRRGAVITGLGMDTTPEEITEAAVEAMAFQAYDLFAAMGEVGAGTKEVAVDGGGAANDVLCQLLADLFGCDVVRPDNTEQASAGAAKAAFAASGSRSTGTSGRTAAGRSASGRAATRRTPTGATPSGCG